MESKILIDITPMGVPYLFIHSIITDDLRDKVLSRFIYESGADIGKPPVPLQLAILVNSNGLVQAMIERPDSCEENGAKPSAEIIFKERADKWLQKNLPHELYKRWIDEVIYPILK